MVSSNQEKNLAKRSRSRLTSVAGPSDHHHHQQSGQARPGRPSTSATIIKRSGESSDSASATTSSSRTTSDTTTSSNREDPFGSNIRPPSARSRAPPPHRQPPSSLNQRLDLLPRSASIPSRPTPTRPSSRLLSTSSRERSPLNQAHKQTAPLQSSVMNSPALAVTANEEASAQHIRQVYAYLDKVGVPGDGFAEGIEGTREHKRLSALMGSVRGSDGTCVKTLSDKELDVLKRADRYGFFKQQASERVINLPASDFYPSSSRAANDPSISSNNQLPVSGGHPGMQHLMVSKEHSRIEKWTDMLIGDRRDAGSNILTYRLRPEWDGQRPRFERRCFKGVPDRWRRAVWEMLMIEYQDEHPDSYTPGSDRLRSQFIECLDTPSEQDIQIDLDVPRTINGHVFFHTRYGRGQRALFQVLHAFGMYCSTCGYCQGMGPIAATLLTYFDAEKAFVCMVKIHDVFNYHTVFAPGFPGLLECFYIQERIIEYLIPKVHQAFTEQMISTSSYATKWYITLFANTVSYESQLRLWDIFFLKGIDTMILGSVSIIYALRNSIMGKDFEQILSCLSGKFELEESYSWIRSIKKLSKNREIINLIFKSREQWKGFVINGTANSKIT